MTKRLGTIIITSMCILLNVANADVKPYFGVGGIADLAYYDYGLPNLLNDATEGVPAVVLMGTNFEAGIKFKQWEFYGAYRFTNSLVEKDYYGFYYEEYDAVTGSWHTIRENERRRNSWGEQRFSIGMRRKVISDKYPVVPTIGSSFEYGDIFYREYRANLVEHYISDAGGNDSTWSEFSNRNNNFRYDLAIGISFEIGVEWKITDHFELLSSTQCRCGIMDSDVDDAEHGYYVMSSLSQMFQLRYVFNL
jgi:hypothetical protein